MDKQRGFTLIELLVVIAIIALLMSILMPAMQRVKEQARTIKCMANLKQWALIIDTYVHENDSKFFSGRRTSGHWWVAQLDDRLESYKQNNLWFCPTATKPIYDEHHNLAPRFNVFSAWGIFTRDFKGVPELCEDGVAGSYTLNTYVLATEDPTPDNPDGSTQNNWQSPGMRGAAYVPLFLDSLRFDTWPTEHDTPPPMPDLAFSDIHMRRQCIDRHKGFINSAFCDSSARKVGLKELWTLKWHKRFNTAGPWTKAGGVTSSDWPEWIRPLKDY